MTAALPLVLTLCLAAIVSAALCVLLRPLLLRYALARPNARSSHRVPTPQGGGIAVLAGAFFAIGGAAWTAGLSLPGILPLLLATTLLAVVGAWDDIRPLPAGLRLLLQAGCVALVLVYAVPELRLFPEVLPLGLERALALIAGIWFVNLVNFIDGLDWITVAGLVPLAGAIALSAHLGLIDAESGLIAAALCGGADRLRAVQPAGGETFPRRCRIAAAGAGDSLSALSSGRAGRFHRGADPAALFHHGRDHHARPSSCAWRAGLGGPPLAFLPAGDG